mgnify:CR=1 FL=1
MSQRAETDTELDRLREDNRKLRKINAALIDRVERSSDMVGNAFSMFETAITLEDIAKLGIEGARAKYAAVGRPASTKSALLARAIEDGLLSAADI